MFFFPSRIVISVYNYTNKTTENILSWDCLLVVIFKGELVFCFSVTKAKAMDNKQNRRNQTRR